MRGKKFTKPVGGKKKLGRGEGEGKEFFSPPHPPPPPTFSHRILPFCNESKMAAKHSKDENHLHCRPISLLPHYPTGFFFHTHFLF